MSIKDEILSFPKLFTIKGTLNCHSFRNNSDFLNSNLHERIIIETNFLPTGTDIKERIYCLMNDIDNVTLCKSCNTNNVSFYSSSGYKDYCSYSCAAKGSAHKVKETCIARYGVSSYAKTSEFLERTKKTCLERYGSEFFFNAPEFRDKTTKTNLKNHNTPYFNNNKKAKETCINKYGVDNYAKTEECKNKVKETCQEKYGVEYYSQTKEFIEQVKKTNMENLGVEYPMQSPEVRNKSKETCQEKYGVEYYSQTKEFPIKMVATSMERFGVSHPMQSPEVMDKLKETNQAKYGVNYLFESPFMQDKIKKTINDVYGVDNVFQSDEIKNKIKKTNMENLGVEYPMQSPEVRNKSKETCQEKYNTNSYTQTTEYKEKSVKTNLLRYNAEYHSQRHISKSSIDKLNNTNWLFDQHINKHKSIIKITNELGDVTPTTVNRYITQAGITITRYSSQSLPEILLVQYINENYDTTIVQSDQTVIKPKEIDIYLPEYKLGIEYNGKYWHRPERYDGYDNWMNYHQTKINLCEKQNIKLLHLWETHDNHIQLIDEAIAGEVNNNLQEIYEILYQND